VNVNVFFAASGLWWHEVNMEREKVVEKLRIVRNFVSSPVAKPTLGT
jgi:hypothetical protein